MKTARLIIGIINIIVSLFAFLYAVGAARLDTGGDISGLFIGVATLAAGVICIATRRNKKGGYVSGGLSFLAAIIGFLGAFLITRLLIFSIYNLIVGGIVIIGSLYSEDDKRDIKGAAIIMRGKSGSMKSAFAIIGIVLAVVLFVLGCMVDIPDRRIESRLFGGYTEYVGGDAYNIIIESALRGGEIAGGRAARAVYFSGAAILMVLSCVFLADAQAEEARRKKQNEEID